MTTNTLFARDPASVKTEIVASFAAALDTLWACAESGEPPRLLEIELWKRLFILGREVLRWLLTLQCWRATEEDLRQRGLMATEVSLRLDKDYWAQQTTTFGKIHFPLFAYRDRSPGVPVTRTPAREAVLPCYPKVRSSELCLELECWLAKEFPFRKAQQALALLTHGQVSLEDTTIAAHMRAIGGVIDRRWLYRPVEKIAELIAERATRDAETGRPIVYLSTDAHNERLYVDDTWDAAWKCANGIRLWIVDRRTGATVHLGGEFTWGNCNEVGRIIEELIASGILPRDGDYGDDLIAEFVVITDGMPWIEDHVLSRLPWAQPVLDLYHALHRLGEFAAELFRRAKKKAKAWYNRLASHLVPRRGSGARKPKTRKNHRKRRPGQSPPARKPRQDIGCGFTLLGALYEDSIPKRLADEFDKLLNYFEHNAYRMDYRRYEQRGFQLGSGAMESLHRSGGQLRLKIPGGTWLQSTSQAIFNLRMLDLAGRWSDFWAQADLSQLITRAFDPQTVENAG